MGVGVDWPVPATSWTQNNFTNMCLNSCFELYGDPVRRRKTRLFAMPFDTKHVSFYQDRLGTNIGKALKEKTCAFSAGH
jgi:hypothetical protein